MKREDSVHKHKHEKVSIEVVRGAVAKAIILNAVQVKSRSLLRRDVTLNGTLNAAPKRHAITCQAVTLYCILL